MKSLILQKTTQITLVGAAIVLAGCMLIAKYTLTNHSRSHLLLLELEVDRASDLYLYYDYGNGYNEGQLQKRLIPLTNSPAFIEFSISAWEQLKALRLDFDPGSLNFKLLSGTILYHGEDQQSVDLASAEVLGGAELKSQTPELIEVQIGELAHDPMIVFNHLPPAPGTSSGQVISHYILWILIGITIVILGVAIYRYFLMQSGPGIQSFHE